MNPSSIVAPPLGAVAERTSAVRLRLPPRPAPALRSAPAGLVAVQPDASVWEMLLGGAPFSAAETAALSAIVRVGQVPPTGLVFAQGEQAHGLFAVIEGDVALGTRTADGSFRTERHHHGPAWLDLSAAWLGEAHALDARALGPARVVELPRDLLIEAADRHPGLWRRLVVVLSREVRGLAHNTHELMHKDAPARLAAWLLQHCRSEGADGAEGQTALVQLPVRKRDIASQLAITPETLSRLMRSFTGRGILSVAGYTVHVLDVPALQRLAQGA